MLTGAVKQWRRRASEVVFDVAFQLSAHGLATRVHRLRRRFDDACDATEMRVRKAGGKLRGCGCLDEDAEGCATQQAGDGGWCECHCHTENDRDAREVARG